MLKKSKLYIMIERIIKEESEAETVQITNIKKMSWELYLSI